MKNKAKLLVFPITVLLLLCTSCAPPKDKDHKSHNHKQIDQELQDNQNEIKQLGQELSRVQELVKEQSPNTNTKDNNDYATNEQLTELRNDVVQMRNQLLRLIEEQNKRIDQKLEILNNKIGQYKTYLDQSLNSYVKISDFETIIRQLEKKFAQKQELLVIQARQETDRVERQKLAKEVEKLSRSIQADKTEIYTYLAKAMSHFVKSFEVMIEKNNNKITTEIKKIIKEEIARIKISQENIKAQIAAVSALQKKQQSILNKDKKQIPIVVDYEEQIQALEQLLDQSKSHLDKIGSITGNVDKNDELVNDLVYKMFSPCGKRGSLKSDGYCYSLGAMIHKLGGDFVDPVGFKRTKKDLLRYLVLSGVSTEGIVNKTNTFLEPSSAKTKELFKRCHQDDDFKANIPPKSLWPRGVILSLIMQKIELDLNKLRELMMISRDVKPLNFITAWWRSPCYQKGLGSSQNSDHISASAFDIVFKNKESFNYYRRFIKEQIWDNDSFGLRYPLESADLSFSIGVGLGHGTNENGKMHFGIASPLKEYSAGQLRYWSYGDYNRPFN